MPGFSPIQDRVLVKRVDAEKQTKSGIWIPDNAQEKPQEGIVIAVGKGGFADNGDRIPIAVKSGDRVVFAKYDGVEIHIEGVEHVVCRERDLLGVVEP